MTVTLTHILREAVEKDIRPSRIVMEYSTYRTERFIELKHIIDVAERERKSEYYSL